MKKPIGIRGIKKTRKRAITMIAILFLATITVAADFVLLTTVDMRFTRAAERGVINGWKIKDAEKNLRLANQPNDTSFIDAEYDAVSEYEGVDFNSKKVSSYAEDYIGALKDCREVIKKYDPDKDFDAFWAHFSGPYGKRIKALYKLQNGRRQFDISQSGFEDERADLMLQGWALNKAESINFKTKTAKNGKRVYSAKIKNDSGYTLDYLDLTVELYDKNNKLIETDAAYAENVKRNDMVELKFYEAAPARATNYVITAVNCQRKSKNPSAEKIDRQSTLR